MGAVNRTHAVWHLRGRQYVPHRDDDLSTGLVRQLRPDQLRRRQDGAGRLHADLLAQEDAIRRQLFCTDRGDAHDRRASMPAAVLEKLAPEAVTPGRSISSRPTRRRARSRGRRRHLRARSHHADVVRAHRHRCRCRRAGWRRVLAEISGARGRDRSRQRQRPQAATRSKAMRAPLTPDGVPGAFTRGFTVHLLPSRRLRPQRLPPRVVLRQPGQHAAVAADVLRGALPQMIRPQMKWQKEHKAMIDALQGRRGWSSAAA